MRVHELIVFVDVTVPSDETIGVVVVMSVGVLVLMGVLDVLVAMRMLVGGPQGQPDADGRDQHRHHLNDLDGVRQHDPRQDGTDERRGREDHLPASRA